LAGLRKGGAAMKTIALALIALVLAAATAAHAVGSSSADIEIKEFKFAPTALEIRRGTTVTWTNHDEEPHTITSTTGAFGSRGLSNDETFAQTFSRAGTYEYFCALHPRMRATVVVK
jgi:plastocyanin